MMVIVILLYRSYSLFYGVTGTLADASWGALPLATAAGLQTGKTGRIFLKLKRDPQIQISNGRKIYSSYRILIKKWKI